jgi:hypothetical protein
METDVVKVTVISSPLPPVTPLHVVSLGDAMALPTGDRVDYTDTMKILPSMAEVVHLVEDRVFA